MLTVLAVLSAAVFAGGPVPSAPAREVPPPPVRTVAAAGPQERDIDVISITDSYVFTCGIVSCSYFVSRKGTRSAAEYVSRHENLTNAVASGLAGGACTATGAGAAVVGVCIAAATASAGHVMDEMKAAGEHGECLRLHYFYYPTIIPASPSADSSGYCRNG